MVAVEAGVVVDPMAVVAVPGLAVVVGDAPGAAVMVSVLPSEHAAVPKTTTARPAFPISAIAMRRLIRRWVVIGPPYRGLSQRYPGSPFV